MGRVSQKLGKGVLEIGGTKPSRLAAGIRTGSTLFRLLSVLIFQAFRSSQVTCTVQMQSSMAQALGQVTALFVLSLWDGLEVTSGGSSGVLGTESATSSLPARAEYRHGPQSTSQFTYRGGASPWL